MTLSLQTPKCFDVRHMITQSYNSHNDIKLYQEPIYMRSRPESTNRISPVIDCCYAKLCHHPVNLSTKMSALLETTGKHKT